MQQVVYASQTLRSLHSAKKGEDLVDIWATIWTGGRKGSWLHELSIASVVLEAFEHCRQDTRAEQRGCVSHYIIKL